MATLMIRARACLRRGGGYTYDKSTRLLEKGGGGSRLRMRATRRRSQGRPSGFTAI